MVQAFASKPVWAVHGGCDDVVSPDESRQMIEAIQRLRGPGEVHYTEVDDAGHDVWNIAYRDPRFAEFLLRERS